MKTYFITLERSKNRSEHIQRQVKLLQMDAVKIPAIDGRNFTRNDIIRECNVAQVDELRWWLTDGAIACALSHKLAYRKFLETNDKAAFIIEDDIVLPENINAILDRISKQIRPAEIILLHYTAFHPAALSTKGAVQLSDGGPGLYYPVDIKQTIAATAYCLGRTAAEGLLKANTPVEVAADCWHHFFAVGAFDSFRVVYPLPTHIKNFKSSIDYLKNGSLKGMVSEMIDTYKIPFLYGYVNRKRAARVKTMQENFYLAETISPLMK